MQSSDFSLLPERILSRGRERPSGSFRMVEMVFDSCIPTRHTAELELAELINNIADHNLNIYIFILN